MRLLGALLALMLAAGCTTHDNRDTGIASTGGLAAGATTTVPCGTYDVVK